MKYYIPAFLLILVILAGAFYFSPVKGIVTQKLLAKGNHYFNGGAYDLNKAEKYYKIASWLDSKSSTAHSG